VAEVPDNIRAQAIADAKNQARELQQQYEQVRVPWKGERLLFEVASIPIDLVLYNHRSHRIRAELESSPHGKQVMSDPWTRQSQEVIAQLLRHTSGYVDLRENLNELSQLDYGVITPAGVIVNGNTRVAALRDLKVSTFKAVVLPEKATEKAIEDLEAHLQLRKESKQDYSYPNQLLFIEDMCQRGQSAEDIAVSLFWASSRDPERLRKGTEKVQQCLRVLAMIRELMRKSHGKLPITEFDDKRQSLEEIDAAVEKLKATDPISAAKVQDVRMIAMLLQFGYRDIRSIDRDFVAGCVDRLCENGVIQSLVMESPEERDSGPAVDLDPEMVDLFGERSKSTSGDPRIGRLLGAVARSYGNDTIAIPGAGEAADRSQVLAEVKAAIDVAIEDHAIDKEAANRPELPIKLLVKCEKDMIRAKGFIQEVVGDPAFSRSEAKRVLDRVIRCARALEVMLVGGGSAQ